MARNLAKDGYRIIATYLNNNPLSTYRHIHGYQVDFRDHTTVERFCKTAIMQCGKRRVAAVIANAGVALGGPVENMPLAIFRECLDINFFGTVQVIQAFIPHLIQSSGRIIVNGSMAGKVALPFMSPYTSSKFALEGFCDSLRRELNPFGIKTILLEPGAVATPIWNNAKEQDISFVDGKYLRSLYKFRDNFIEGGNNGMPPAKAASMIQRILKTRNPRTRYIIADNIFTSKMTSLIPDKILDWAVIRMFDMLY